jgi:hypothetical protein
MKIIGLWVIEKEIRTHNRFTQEAKRQNRHIRGDLGRSGAHHADGVLELKKSNSRQPVCLLTGYGGVAKWQRR